MSGLGVGVRRALAVVTILAAVQVIEGVLQCLHHVDIIFEAEH